MASRVSPSRSRIPSTTTPSSAQAIQRGAARKAWTSSAIATPAINVKASKPSFIQPGTPAEKRLLGSPSSATLACKAQNWPSSLRSSALTKAAIAGSLPLGSDTIVSAKLLIGRDSGGP